ncbi:MAG TPA: nitroreductase/quinone reductase family protein [Ktedonobacterales bacterium]
MKTLEQRPENATKPVQAPPPPPNMKAVNPFVRLLLRSPLHRMLSGALLLLTFTGRKSGKRYTIPVEYSRSGDIVTVFTDHTWWKNLRGGAPVAVEIKRQRFEGVAEAIRDDLPVVSAALRAHLLEHPGAARAYHIPLDANGQPDPDALQQVAQSTTLVRIQLAPPTAA